MSLVTQHALDAKRPTYELIWTQQREIFKVENAKYTLYTRNEYKADKSKW